MYYTDELDTAGKHGTADHHGSAIRPAMAARRRRHSSYLG